MSEFIIVLCTAPADDSDRIAKALVEERLAACVNISPVKSYFIWEGVLNRNPEELMIIKTENKLVQALMKRILELHSYEVPEIIVLSLQGGYEPYLKWVKSSIG